VRNSGSSPPPGSDDGLLHLTNTIIAQNSGGDCSLGANGVIVTNLNNLVEDGSCSSGGVNFQSGDPSLAALGDYGGDTQTYALLLGSPAIDAGDSGSCQSADQRDQSRSVGSSCDLGAFESQGFYLAISGGNDQSTLIDTAFANPLEVTFTASDTNLSVAAGGRVITFTGPASGAGVTTTTLTATTNSSNVASVTVTANSISGAYPVTATAVGVGSATTFNLTNTVADLSLSKAANLIWALSGETITYTIVISNSGGAENVTVTDTLPGSLSGDTLNWSGTLTTNTALAFTLNATILNIPTNYTATIANTAYLYHASGKLNDTVSFNTISDTVAPSDPTLITPANGSAITNTGSLTFSWSAVTDDLSGLDYYTLQVDSSNDGLSIQASSDSITTTQTGYTPTNALANGVYTWTVRAQGLVGNVSSGVSATFAISATSSSKSIYLPIVVKNN